MASNRLAIVESAGAVPTTTWAYRCDTEADVTAELPKECVLCLVAEPAAGKSAVRLRKSDGSWAEVG